MEVIQDEEKELRRLKQNQKRREAWANRTPEQVERDKERKKIYMKEYYQKNKEKHAEYMRGWRLRRKLGDEQYEHHKN